MTTVISPVNIDSRKGLDMRPGDTVRVWQKIQDKEKTRLQAFEGMVLARKHGAEAGATFTVRRSTGGYGVEKIYPLYSPMIDKIEVLKRSKVRRGKLYYIREKALKQISKRMRMMFVNFSDEVKEEDKPEEVAEDKVEGEAVAETPETPEAVEVAESPKEDVIVEETLEAKEKTKE